MSLTTALAAVAEHLHRARVDYMVIGGIAATLWGEPRGTRDVDVTVDVGDVDSLVALARELGQPIPDDPAAFAERTRFLPIRTAEGVEVDLILATLSFELDAIARAREVRVEGVPVKICTPEDLVVHKIVSERPRDLEDVVGVLRRQPELDLAALDSMVRTLATELAEPSIAERWAGAKAAAGLTER